MPGGEMAEVVRVGAVAKVDPDPEAAVRTLEEGERIEGPEELEEWLGDYRSGRQVVVQLELFADVIDGNQVERIDSLPVPGCWFQSGSTAANVQHAAEMAKLNLERLRDDLAGHGVAVSLEALEAMPPVVVIDHD